MADTLRLLQININKRKAAQASLMVKLDKIANKNFMAVIQEPHLKGSYPFSITKKSLQTFHGKGTKELRPRAMIVASKSIEICDWEINLKRHDMYLLI